MVSTLLQILICIVIMSLVLLEKDLQDYLLKVGKKIQSWVKLTICTPRRMACANKVLTRWDYFFRRLISFEIIAKTSVIIENSGLKKCGPSMRKNYRTLKILRIST